jgi:2-polyprenyl-6-methoxyphenol hydroxylase-like FAD-dependent oxidoreductase
LKRIGVVGCGIGGMAAAIALARDGHDVHVFERFAQPHPVGAGLLLQPSGLQALGALGLRGAVEAKGARVTALHGRNARGRTVLNIRYESWRPGAYGVGIHRACLFDALHDALRGATVRLRTNTDIVRIETPAAPVLIASDGAQHGPFDLVVIADGAASRLRAQVTPKARAPLYPWGAIWTIRPDPENRWAGVLAQKYDGARVMIGVLPVGATPASDTPHVALFWSLREDEYQTWRNAGLEHWRANVARYWPEAANLLDGDVDFDALNFARYRDVQAWPWGAGACLLIGDAAHATSPQLGQGANLALVDAVTLAAHLKDAPVAQALAGYRRARRGKIAWVQLMSAALTPVFQSRSRLIGALRDLFLPLATRLWPFDRLMLATLTGAGALPGAMLLSGVARFLIPARRRSSEPESAGAQTETAFPPR